MRENEEEAQIDRLPVDVLAHIFFLLSSFRDLAQFSFFHIPLSVSLSLCVCCVCVCFVVFLSDW